jgi:WD40 repeat protein
MDPLRVACPECESTLRVPATAAGKRVKCPRCGKPVPVPVAEEEEKAVRTEPAASPQAPAKKAPPRPAPAEDEEEQDERPRARKGTSRKRKPEKSKAPLIIAIVLGVVAIGGGTVGAILLLRNRGEDSRSARLTPSAPTPPTAFRPPGPTSAPSPQDTSGGSWTGSPLYSADLGPPIHIGDHTIQPPKVFQHSEAPAIGGVIHTWSHPASKPERLIQIIVDLSKVNVPKKTDDMEKDFNDYLSKNLEGAVVEREKSEHGKVNGRPFVRARWKATAAPRQTVHGVTYFAWKVDGAGAWTPVGLTAMEPATMSPSVLPMMESSLLSLVSEGNSQTLAWSVQPDPAPEALPQGPFPSDASISVDPAYRYSLFASPYVIGITSKSGRAGDNPVVYDLRTMKPVGAPLAETPTVILVPSDSDLSPDGKYWAAPLGDAPKTKVGLWSVATGKQCKVIVTRSGPDDSVSFLHFLGNDRLLTASFDPANQEQPYAYQVWTIPTGERKARWTHENTQGMLSTTVSPGGRYVAMVGSKDVEIVETASGKVAGVMQFRDPSARRELAALAFRRDGRQLAMLVWDESKNKPSEGHILCWDLTNGRKLLDHLVGNPVKDTTKVLYYRREEALLWHPEGQSWLLFRHLLVDCASGKIIGRIGQDPTTARVEARTFVGAKHITDWVPGPDVGVPGKLRIIPLPPPG